MTEAREEMPMPRRRGEAPEPAEGMEGMASDMRGLMVAAEEVLVEEVVEDDVDDEEEN